MKRELLSDIFGIREGEVFSAGLVDKESEEAFDVGLGRLHKRWEKLAPGFHKWFVTQQADSFRRCMILPVRERAQLGSPPAQFTNNPNESSNGVVKHWVGFRKSSWPAFVEKLQKLVEAQLAEADKALYGCGNYSLASEFACFEIDAVTWHKMSSAQRKAHLRKITVSMTQSIENLSKKLSLPAAEVRLSFISSSSLKSMWEKAERLLNMSNAVLPAPGSKNAFMVLSDSSSRPHFVQQKAGGKVLCDDDCPMWRGRKICSHTIAVAEHLNCLQEFLQVLQKSTPGCNLTSMVTTITDRHKAGTKSGAPKRGEKVCPSTPIVTYKSRLDDVCPTSEEVPVTTNTLGGSSVEANGSKDVTVGCYNNFYTTPPHYGSPAPSQYGNYPPSHYGNASFSGYGNAPLSNVPLGSPLWYDHSGYYMYGAAFQPPPWVNSPSNSVPLPQPTKPFLVKLLNNRIRKCRGCNRNFSRKVDGSPPDPPLDLVVAHEERHPFFDAQNVRKVSRPQNTYYHTSLSCIRANNPAFVGGQLQVPADVELSPVHKKYLREHFGCAI